MLGQTKPGVLLNMSAPFDIMFHLGAHKTASTHLQNILLDQTDYMNAHGVQYLGPMHMRRGVVRFQQLPKRLWAEFQDAQAADSWDYHRVVVSEENFLGPLVSKHGTTLPPPLYKQAVQKLRDFRADAPDIPLHLAICVRNPCALIASSYSQYLLGGRFKPWDHYIQWLDFGRHDYNWAHLIQRIAGAQVAHSITVWAYKDYRALLPTIFKRFTGLAPQFSKGAETSLANPSLSADAIAAVTAGQGQGLRMSELVQTAQAQYPVGPLHAKFQPWPPQVLHEMTQRYQHQLRQIAAMDGVTFLRPPKTT